MRLYLLRHGIAEDVSTAKGGDRARKLTPEGRHRISLAAKALARLGVKPSRIYASPLPRALETARLTAEALDLSGAARVEPRLEPGASPKTLAQILREAIGQNAESIMLVGHNPDLEFFMAWLTAAGGQASLALKKGSLAEIEIDGAEALTESGHGRLLALWPGKTLAELASPPRRRSSEK